MKVYKIRRYLASLFRKVGFVLSGRVLEGSGTLPCALPDDLSPKTGVPSNSFG